MAYAPKRRAASATTSSLARAKRLKPESFERLPGSEAPTWGSRDRHSGVHESEKTAPWWAEGLTACESEEVSADLSKDPRRER